MVELKVRIKDCPFHAFERQDISANNEVAEEAFNVWRALLTPDDMAFIEEIKATELAQSLWRMAWYISTSMPVPEHSGRLETPYTSLVLYITHLALKEFRSEFLFGEQYAQSKATQIVVRNLGLLYRLRVTTCQKALTHTPSSTWDCVSSSVRDWVFNLSANRTGYLSRKIAINTVEPEWSMVSEFDAGLLFAGAFFTRTLLRHYQIPDVTLNTPHRVTCFDDGRELRNAKERYLYLRRNVKPETVRRIERTEFTNSNVSYICWRFARFFGGYLEHPTGGSFIDIELCNAVTCFNANLKTHGAAYAFRCFTHYIARILPYAYQVVARDPKNEDSEWNCLEETFAEWLGHDVKELDITVQLGRQTEPTPKATYLLMRHVFDRSDMGLWNIPLQGWKYPAHQWGVYT